MRLILCLIITLIMYGSLYPFNFVWQEIPWDQWLLLDSLHHRAGRTDIVGNVLLFIPYGLMGLVYHRYPIALRILLIFFSGLLLAYCLQILQLYLPSRDAALGDAMYNGLGLLIGIGIGLCIHLMAKQSWSRWNEATAIGLFLLACWIGYRCFPFIAEWSQANINASWQPLRDWPYFHPWQTLQICFAWLLCFRIMHFIVPNSSLRWAPLCCVLLLFAAELVMKNNLITWNDLLGSTLALLLFACLRYQTYFDALLLCGAFISWALFTLSPFAWQSTPSDFNWLPFKGFLHGALWSNSVVLLHKTFIYGSLLYLLRRKYLWLNATIMLGLYLLLLEIAQQFSRYQQADITNPVLVLLIALTLATLERVFHQANQSLGSSATR